MRARVAGSGASSIAVAPFTRGVLFVLAGCNSAHDDRSMRAVLGTRRRRKQGQR